MFKFKDLIQTGMKSANQVELNRESINEVFNSLNDELNKETQGLLTIKRFVGKPNIFSISAKTYTMLSQGLVPVSIERKHDIGTLNIVLSDGSNASIARWEQHPDGYPFTIEFLGERTDCWDQGALISMLGNIVGSGQLWLKVKELQSKAQEESENDNLQKE